MKYLLLLFSCLFLLFGCESNGIKIPTEMTLECYHDLKHNIHVVSYGHIAVKFVNSTCEIVSIK